MYGRGGGRKDCLTLRYSHTAQHTSGNPRGSVLKTTKPHKFRPNRKPNKDLGMGGPGWRRAMPVAKQTKAEPRAAARSQNIKTYLCVTEHNHMEGEGDEKTANPKESLPS